MLEINKDDVKFYGLKNFPKNLNTFMNQLDEIMVQVDFTKIEKVVFVGCGASKSSGESGAFYFNKYTHKIAFAYSGYQLYVNPPKFIDDKTLVVAISHSGKTPEVIKAINEVKKLGAKTLAMTCFEDTDLAKATDQVIVYKMFSWISQIMVYLKLVEQATPIESFKDVLNDMNQNLVRVLLDIYETYESTAKELGVHTKKWMDFNQIAIGNAEALASKTTVTAMEFLWTKNSFINASDLSHGYFEVIDHNNWVVYHGLGKGRYATQKSIDFIKEHNGNYVIFDAEDFMKNLHEDLAVIVLWLPLQMWLMEFAIQHGHHPDDRKYYGQVDFWKFNE